jgi:ornithine carbamoyltransferase
VADAAVEVRSRIRTGNMAHMAIEAQPPGGGNLLKASDLEPGQVRELLDLARRMKEAPPQWLAAHAGESVACYFERPSTRTRVSVQAAAQRLGLLPIVLGPEALPLGLKERASDTARALSSYAAAIVIATASERVLTQIADAADVPVLNAVSELHHPCQALADLLTLHEQFGRLEGLRLAYVGAAANVANSLLEACALAGIDLRVASPAHYDPDTEVEYAAREIARSTGARIEVGRDPRHAVEGADAVYTDLWREPGDQRRREALVQALEPYRVTNELMTQAGRDAVFMHCLPAHRGQEVEERVVDGPRSLVWNQVANRLPIEQAILHTLIAANADPGRR